MIHIGLDCLFGLVKCSLDGLKWYVAVEVLSSSSTLILVGGVW